MIKIFVLTVFLVAVSLPALACRGSAEFPQALQTLAQAEMPEDQKLNIRARLREAEALHSRGHEEGNGAMMGRALMVLDDVKAKMAK